MSLFSFFPDLLREKCLLSVTGCFRPILPGEVLTFSRGLFQTCAGKYLSSVTGCFKMPVEKCLLFTVCHGLFHACPERSVCCQGETLLLSVTTFFRPARKGQFTVCPGRLGPAQEEVLTVYPGLFQVQEERRRGDASADLPREKWPAYDPNLVAEAMFAAANIFSSLKLIYMFTVNPYLGPLQISLGRMLMDIFKFFVIFLLVLFSFACGLNHLYWYYAEVHARECATGDEEQRQISCDRKYRSFAK